MESRLGPEELREYRERGFVVRAGVFAGSELAPLRAAVECVHSRVAEVADGAPVERIDGKRYQSLLGSTVKWEWREELRQVRSMEPFCHLDERLERLVDDPRLWGPCRQLVGSEALALFTDKLNFKRPGGSPFPWHQDTPYWAFGCAHVQQLASLQLYLDPATRENGCLWVIPGSHRFGVLPKYEDRGTLGRLYTDVERLELEEPVPIEAPAGSVVWFHGDVVHGSLGNKSAADRRAIVLTYQPAGHPAWNRPAERPIRPARAPSA